MSKFNGNGRKGQGAFEYILLLAGVLLVVVLAIVILKGSVLQGAGTSITSGQNTAAEGSCTTQYQNETNANVLLSGWNQTLCCTHGMADTAGQPVGNLQQTGAGLPAANKLACCKTGIIYPRTATQQQVGYNLALGTCQTA